jgi:acyl carrier protein
MTSDPAAIFAMVRECVADVFGISPDSVTPATRLGEDLGADSLDLVEIVSRIEARSGIVAEPSRLASISTVGDTCAALVADGAEAAG